MAKVNKADRQDSIERLRERLKPGDKLTAIVSRVSRSGYGARSINFYKQFVENGEIRQYWLTRDIARALEMKYEDARETLRVYGSGMDMVFHTLYSLGRVLWPEGYQCTGAGCPSADHNNKPWPVADGTAWHNDSYAISEYKSL